VDVTFTLHPSGSLLDYVRIADSNGKLVVEPKEANINKDTHLITKMNPLVVIRFGNENCTSAVSSGKNPSWTDVMSFDRTIDEDTLIIELWDFNDFGNNDLLGEGYASITDSLSGIEKNMKKIELSFMDKPIGEIVLTLTFK
jgi:Ca2+-dependent lipid-binding protein